MDFEEHAVLFDCEGETLVGIIATPASPGDVAVLVIVGGPQYRVGSHRQFVLLSRALAEAGIPTMRFDHRGVGDSSGAMRSFEAIDMDIRAAMDALFARVDGLSRVVLWGLCDGASAACFYAASDARVAGLVLLNPWVRTDAGEAATYLRHYYGQRLLDRGFWRKLLSGDLALGTAARSLVSMVGRAGGSARAASLALPDRMANALGRFSGRLLLVLSGNDYTAAEFRDVVSKSVSWQAALPAGRVARLEIPEADHTFSTPAWRDEVAAATRQWIQELT